MKGNTKNRMENREAIGLIRQMIKDNEEDGGVEFGNKDKEALTLAISALEQERWIPVTEKLPKPNTNVILKCRAEGYTEKYRYFITIGCYIPALTVKIEEKWNDEFEEVEVYDEKNDTYYCKEGWYEETTQGDGDHMSWYMSAEVIEWRPLPE